MSAQAGKSVLVWGAGAIGGTLAASLARAGRDVTAVDAALEHVAAIRGAGLRVSGADDFIAQLPIFAPDEVQGRWDLVVLAVKAHHTAEAAEQIVPYLAPGGGVLALQNGMPGDVVARFVPRDRVYVALVNIAADYVEPGHIRLAYADATPVGPVDGGDGPLTDDFVEVVRACEPTAFAAPDVQSYVWAKHAFNGLLAATAMAESPFRQLVAEPRFEAVWRALLGETVRVALAVGITPRVFDGLDVMAFAPGAAHEAGLEYLHVSANMPGPSKTHSGSWRDIAVLHRKTEIAALLDPIAELGEAKGVSCDTLRRVVTITSAIERGERPQKDDNLLELIA